MIFLIIAPFKFIYMTFKLIAEDTEDISLFYLDVMTLGSTRVIRCLFYASIYTFNDIMYKIKRSWKT